MACTSDPVTPRGGPSFSDQVLFVESFSRLIVLSDPSRRAMIAISPSMQGRVLTSSADGWDWRSYGWVNRELISSGKVQQHINAFGGEDRLWIGPEAGPFSVFFAPGQPFDLSHWRTPAPLDTEPFEVENHSRTAVDFRKAFTLVNYSGTEFKVRIHRRVRLLPNEEALKDLELPYSSGLRVVGFESINRLTNTGKETWRKQTGLLSLWILGQFPASPATTVTIPIREGPVLDLGEAVNADYFGVIPPDRVSVQSNTVYFKADARYRSKLGVNSSRAKDIFGSYDAQSRVLTLVRYTLPREKADYVNSAWKLQVEPYKGDAINSYNDGPLSSGGPQLGDFYELESSSPAAALAPAQSIQHVQRTFHLEGNEERLDQAAHTVLGVGVDAIRNALANQEKL